MAGRVREVLSNNERVNTRRSREKNELKGRKEAGPNGWFPEPLTDNYGWTCGTPRRHGFHPRVSELGESLLMSSLLLAKCIKLYFRQVNITAKS